MCDQNQSKPILKTCFFPRGVSLKNFPINETSNTNAAPGPLPGPAPPPTADGQGFSCPAVRGAHGTQQAPFTPKQARPFRLQAIFTATLLLVCQKNKNTGRPHLHHLPKTMWICPKYTCEFWVWKYWSLKRWEGQDLTTKDFLLCCSFQWAKQNYWQFSPI